MRSFSLNGRRPGWPVSNWIPIYLRALAYVSSASQHALSDFWANFITASCINHIQIVSCPWLCNWSLGPSFRMWIPIFLSSFHWKSKNYCWKFKTWKKLIRVSCLLWMRTLKVFLPYLMRSLWVLLNLLWWLFPCSTNMA